MDLVRDFERAGLALQMPHDPIMATNADIFQMDIQRQRGREWFRMWRGHDWNQIRVTDVDRGRHQLVLQVQESTRAFRERLDKRTLDRYALKRAVASGSTRVVRTTQDEVVIERWTSNSLRRFLCGHDERHLFVAQVPGGTTVRDAHRLLKPEVVREAERSGVGRILRQGEWFFTPLSEVERRLLAQALERAPYLVKRRESLGGNGRPHIAEEVAIDGDRTYARGAVRHPDHKTLVLQEWRRVHRNAEVHQDAFGSNGVYWID